MGLIREPKNVDFYVTGQTWTKEEKDELSEIIKKLKARSKAKRSPATGKQTQTKVA